MILRKNIATSENGFIFNPATGDSFSSNDIAAEIINGLKDGKPAYDIKQSIVERYDVEYSALERDWDDLMAQLKDANLLEH